MFIFCAIIQSWRFRPISSHSFDSFSIIYIYIALRTYLALSRKICTFCVYTAYPLAHQPMILHLFIYSCVGPCRFSQSVHLNISMKAHQIPTSWKKMVRPRPRHWDQTSPVAERWWEHIPEPHVSACLSPLGICSQFWPSRTSRTRNHIQDVIAQMILGRRSVGLLGLDWKGVQLSFCLILVDTLEPLNL